MIYDIIFSKKKTKTLRTKSGKKPGGQEGHNDKTLELTGNPDEIIVHTVDKCDICELEKQKWIEHFGLYKVSIYFKYH